MHGGAAGRSATWSTFSMALCDSERSLSVRSGRPSPGPLGLPKRWTWRRVISATRQAAMKAQRHCDGSLRDSIGVSCHLESVQTLLPFV